ncbi:SDR family NAD(P)-dependent oxidoreductase [Haloactinomyces albus]|uniref:NAD(P)-dependent dehydrogenase (Short-subunit alcohol dehydrogenase family) n=1 Tax=Haloactinomyces albus TaxID=1352928 RepID=A0AAE3ZHS9_9ACTN|nr:SDR family NAD(P)-dependent oxidoreductase [Haloactinomyces albus]MDR7303920.1 NAD(P)-dependent dehydrogenase (short-subunit alcohol dehydrogenase family) [Haloactinomyces albus]
MADTSTSGSIMVTGAARGIGAAIAERFARSGFTVFGLDRDAEAIERSARSWPGPGSHTAVEADVVDESAVTAACARAAAVPGGLRAFIGNAGHHESGPSFDYSLESWRKMLDVHLTGCFVGARQAASAMSNGGSIIVLSSINGHVGFPGRAAYGAAKAGVAGLVRSLASEWAPDGVRVNGIAPGSIETPLSSKAIRRGVINSDSFLNRIPMNRFGKPEEVAELAYFLGTPLSSYITGVVVPIDGGWLAQGIAADS